ncbi:MAG: DUF1254 domain-containing protein [Bacteroidales bacterium]|jgi:hypothetical protein|nr:DUF1254 domain-containing protein [Bacteroidales bacterium]
MKIAVIFRLIAGILLPAIILSCGSTAKKPQLTKDEAVALAREAYIYVTPLIYTDVTRVTSQVPDNYLLAFNTFPDHTFRHVVAPNNDTNYSTAYLELSKEPVVLEIPDLQNRYYVFPLQDAWTNNFFLPGKRLTGTRPQKYLIAGPNWQGNVPDGLTLVQSPTNIVWAIGRIQVNSPDDQKNFVYPLQKQFVLKPLSAWLNNTEQKFDSLHPRRLYGDFVAAPRNGKSVVEMVKSLSVEAFFNYANALLTDNPPFEADSAVVRRIAAIGVGAGLKFELAGFAPDIQAALEQVPADVYAEFVKPLTGSFFGNRTSDPLAKIGDYKSDYNLRALVAFRGLGALPPEEAVYFSYYADKNNEPLNGQNNYRIHYEKGQLPPAQSFWSYTVYGLDRYLVENPIRRYAIGDRNPLKYNADGSLDIWLSAKSPGKDKEDNWLPTGDKEFNLSLRVYTPTETFLNDRNSWTDPKPEKIN